MSPRRIGVSLAVVLLAALLLSPAARMAVLAVLLMPHLFPGAVPRPLRLITAPPTVTSFEVPGAPGRMLVDLYRPAGDGRRPAMILLLGVNPLPRDHEQVVTLAEGIARTGIATAVAASDALEAGEIRVEEIDNLVALFEHLERDPGIDPNRIGFSGFCVGAVLELIAAADPRIASRVAYVNAFSVYADTLDVVRAVLSESMPTASGSAPWQPDPLARTVFVRHVIGAIPSSGDRALLTRELLEDTVLTSPELEALSPLGHEVRNLVRSRSLAEIDRLLSSLPDDFRNRFQRLSPGAGVQRLEATTFLMHDQSDTYLPVSGARRLATLLPERTGAHYSEFRLFAHVVPGGADDPLLFAGEIFKLIRHITDVMLAAHTGRVSSQ